jgi:hypothetical protein
VRVWRRLRAIGAVALKRTVYLLPDTPDHYEHLQWLAQEIQRAGSEATRLRVERLENMSSEEVVQLFHEARNSEYRRLGGRYRKVFQTLDRKPAATSPWVQAELAQLQRDYEKPHELDFFEAPGGAEVDRLREAIDMRTRPSEEPKRREKTAPSSATSEGGDNCTFETLIKRAGLRDRRLTRLAEIVHEADDSSNVSEFVAMAKGLAGGSGWVLLVYVPRDRRLINQYAGDQAYVKISLPPEGSQATLAASQARRESLQRAEGSPGHARTRWTG